MLLTKVSLRGRFPGGGSLTWLKPHAPHVSPESLLLAGRTYDQPPKLGADGWVRAQLTCPRHTGVAGLGGITGQVGLRMDTAAQPVVEVVCNCPQSGFCVHALTWLADMSVDGEFGAAVLHGRVTPELLDALDVRRAEVLASFRADRVLEPWMGNTPSVKTKAPSYQIEPAWFLMQGSGWGRLSSGTTPGLVLRIHVDGKGRAMAPRDVDRAALPDEDRALLSLCKPGDLQDDDAFTVAGPAAAMVLEMVQGRDVRLRDRLDVKLEFKELALWPKVARRQVPAGWFGKEAGEDAATVDALEAAWALDDGTLSIPMARTHFFPGARSFVLVRDKAWVVAVPKGVDSEMASRLQRAPVLELDGRVDAAPLFMGLRSRMRGRRVRLPTAAEMGAPELGDARFTLQLDGTALDVRGRLLGTYPFGDVDVLPGKAALDARRDAVMEDQVLTAVAAAGLKPAQTLHVAQDDDAVTLWTEGLEMLSRTAPAGLEVVLAPELRRVKVGAPARVSVHTSLVDGLLKTHVDVRSSELLIDIARVREALKAKRRWMTLSDGLLVELQDRVRAFLEDAEPLLDANGFANLPKHHLGRVNAWLEEMEGATCDEGVDGLRKKLRAAEVAKHPKRGKGFTGELRAYQEQGVAWLQFLEQLGVGGILADDMGLGKTVQVLAWLCWQRDKPKHAVTLVVCPTSVAPNWMEEAQRFAPELRTLLWHGDNRAQGKGKPFDGVDVVVTTYGVLRQDAELLVKHHFHTLILDEAQTIKNVDAVTTRVVRQLQATHRVALTGTPVENRLLELWSIMEACNPGLLGNRSRFEGVMEKTVMKDPGGFMARRIKATVSPFILRRTKAQVLQDLPEKQEMDHRCEMGEAQKRMYDAVAAMVRKDVRKQLEKKGEGKVAVDILAALTRLRQVACDPRLVDATVPADQCAKRAAFVELLDELVAEGRRVLVFSQFVELLKLWKQDLERLNIPFEWLDGSTRNRAAVVKRFQEGDAPVFMISLKAGGTGLNLTAADTVILCDPWWNPAVEDQAADRAHRMGQTRRVSVYRLLAAGTVEERIQQLKVKKRELIGSVLPAGEMVPKGLSSQDLAELLGDVTAVHVAVSPGPA